MTTLAPAAPARTRRTWRWPGFLTAPVTLGLVVLLFWLFTLITVQWWAPYGPLEAAGPRLQSPSSSHWLGTDVLGRDVFSRVMYGARTSLPIAAAVIATAVTIGCLVGPSPASSAVGSTPS
jgi:peptide/nickel transport system permease protein